MQAGPDIYVNLNKMCLFFGPTMLFKNLEIFLLEICFFMFLNCFDFLILKINFKNEKIYIFFKIFLSKIHFKKIIFIIMSNTIKTCEVGGFDDNIMSGSSLLYQHISNSLVFGIL